MEGFQGFTLSGSKDKRQEARKARHKTFDRRTSLLEGLRMNRSNDAYSKSEFAFPRPTTNYHHPSSFVCRRRMATTI